jgi:PAS domain S-box-containing protein
MAEALSQAREKEKVVLANMLVGLITINQYAVIESVNARIKTIFGYEPEELIGQRLNILFPDNGNNDSRNVQEIIDKSTGKITELEAQRKEKENFPIELSFTKFVTADGVRLLANILDVSERHELEKLKRAFVANVTHELRTPLTSIRGSLTLLNSGALGDMPPQQKNLISIAERNTLRLISLINDILDVEKLESGKIEMQFSNVPINKIVDHSLESVKAFGDQHNVGITTEPGTEIIWCDEDRIVQVLVNLLSNAIKFSPKGETVKITHSQENGFVEIKVSDKGRGIPEKYKDLIFQRFQQVEASYAKSRGGTGLGLAICKQIIEQHGGTIGVESKENHGSTFWFRLAMAKESSSPYS